MTGPLSEATVSQAKAMLWEGYTQTSVVRRLGIPKDKVSKIFHGVLFERVPWPDGSTGGYPAENAGRQRSRRAKMPGPDSGLELGAVETSERIRQALMDGAYRIEDLAAASSLTPEQIDEIFESTNREYQEAHLALAHGSGEEVEDTRKAAMPSYRQIEKVWKDSDWSRVLGDQEHETKEGETLEIAVCLVLQELPRQDWGSDLAARLVADAADWVMANREEVMRK